MENKNETIESLKKKIHFWEEQLKKTRNYSDACIFADKIKEARKQINDLKYPRKNEPEVQDQIDAPMLVDKDEKPEIPQQRGQVIGATNIFKMSI